MLVTPERPLQIREGRRMSVRSSEGPEALLSISLVSGQVFQHSVTPFGSPLVGGVGCGILLFVLGRREALVVSFLPYMIPFTMTYTQAAVAPQKPVLLVLVCGHHSVAFDITPQFSRLFCLSRENRL